MQCRTDWADSSGRDRLRRQRQALDLGRLLVVHGKQTIIDVLWQAKLSELVTG